MDTKNDGGPAFPDPGRAQSAKQREKLTETGMTLRDYFAAKAMQALMDQGIGATARAAAAYREADAMLIARGAA